MNAVEVHTQRVTGSIAQEESRLRPVRIEVLGSGLSPSHVVVSHGTVFVGSSDDCDVVVADRKVSRRHLSVELLGAEVRVQDLGSRNGTRYLGARIQEARVPIGGAVLIGTTTLRFAYAEERQPESEKSELCGLIGVSRAMRRVFAVLERLGPADSTVLIRGETGCGKEAVARALHELSGRPGEVEVFDCASVNSNLIESELFGHVKGAFTHAQEDRAGCLERAANGTLFLDEIGELPLDVQPKLLRALENREFRRVGSGQVRKMNARVVAATHRDLEAEVRRGRFRADLFFRLGVAVLDVPPLRERAEDIPLLARRFVRELGADERVLDSEQLATLRCELWPGNVRELRNAVERLVALGSLQRSVAAVAGTSFKQAREWLLVEFEKKYLHDNLQRYDGNISAAARASGLSRSQFYRLLWQHGLVERERGGAPSKGRTTQELPRSEK